MLSRIGLQSWNKACEYDLLVSGIIYSKVIKDLFARGPACRSCHPENAKTKQGKSILNACLLCIALKMVSFNNLVSRDS